MSMVDRMSIPFLTYEIEPRDCAWAGNAAAVSRVSAMPTEKASMERQLAAIVSRRPTLVRNVCCFCRAS